MLWTERRPLNIMKNFKISPQLIQKFTSRRGWVKRERSNFQGWLYHICWWRQWLCQVYPLAVLIYVTRNPTQTRTITRPEPDPKSKSATCHSLVLDGLSSHAVSSHFQATPPQHRLHAAWWWSQGHATWRHPPGGQEWERSARSWGTCWRHWQGGDGVVYKLDTGRDDRWNTPSCRGRPSVGDPGWCRGTAGHSSCCCRRRRLPQRFFWSLQSNLFLDVP